MATKGKPASQIKPAKQKQVDELLNLASDFESLDNESEKLGGAKTSAQLRIAEKLNQIGVDYKSFMALKIPNPAYTDYMARKEAGKKVEAKAPAEEITASQRFQEIGHGVSKTQVSKAGTVVTELTGTSGFTTASLAKFVAEGVQVDGKPRFKGLDALYDLARDISARAKSKSLATSKDIKADVRAFYEGTYQFQSSVKKSDKSERKQTVVKMTGTDEAITWMNDKIQGEEQPANVVMADLILVDKYGGVLTIMQESGIKVSDWRKVAKEYAKSKEVVVPEAAPVVVDDILEEADTPF